MNARTLACVITTPLGSPVEPDVNRMWAASCGPFAVAGSVVGYRVKSAGENCAVMAAGGSSAPSQPIEWVSAKPGDANSASSVAPTGPLARIQRLSHEALPLEHQGARIGAPAGLHGDPVMQQGGHDITRSAARSHTTRQRATSTTARR